MPFCLTWQNGPPSSGCQGCALGWSLAGQGEWMPVCGIALGMGSVLFKMTGFTSSFCLCIQVDMSNLLVHITVSKPNKWNSKQMKQHSACFGVWTNVPLTALYYLKEVTIVKDNSNNNNSNNNNNNRRVLSTCVTNDYLCWSLILYIYEKQCMYDLFVTYYMVGINIHQLNPCT